MGAFVMEPLTPEQERDLRVDLGDRSEKPDHVEGCTCEECQQADDARDMLRIFATLDRERDLLVRVGKAAVYGLSDWTKPIGAPTIKHCELCSARAEDCDSRGTCVGKELRERIASMPPTQDDGKVEVR